MKKTVHKLFCAGCILALSTALTGCIVINTNPGPADPIPVVKPEPGQTPGGNQGTSGNQGTATSQVKVLTWYNDSGNWSDPDGGTKFFYNYTLPEVQGPTTQYIEDINKFMRVTKEEYIDPSIAGMNRGEGPGYHDVSYEVGTIGEYTTILLAIQSFYDGECMYFTWIIDGKGEQASGQDLMAAKGVSSEAVLEALDNTAVAILGPFEYDTWVKEFGKDMADEMEAAYHNTRSNANINVLMPFFISEDGDLCVVMNIYTAVGSGMDTYVFRTGF